MLTKAWNLNVKVNSVFTSSSPSLFSPVSVSVSVSELIDGTPTLKINHGSGTLVLQLPGNVNVADRRWHRLDVRSNSKVGMCGWHQDLHQALNLKGIFMLYLVWTFYSSLFFCSKPFTNMCILCSVCMNFILRHSDRGRNGALKSLYME